MKTIFAAIRLKVFASGAVATNTNALTYRGFGDNEKARLEWLKRRFGGHYDVNALMDLYPQMSKGYGTTGLSSLKTEKYIKHRTL